MLFGINGALQELSLKHRAEGNHWRPLLAASPQRSAECRGKRVGSSVRVQQREFRCRKETRLSHLGETDAVVGRSVYCSSHFGRLPTRSWTFYCIIATELACERGGVPDVRALKRKLNDNAVALIGKLFCRPSLLIRRVLGLIFLKLSPQMQNILKKTHYTIHNISSSFCFFGGGRKPTRRGTSHVSPKSSCNKKHSG